MTTDNIKVSILGVTPFGAKVIWYFHYELLMQAFSVRCVKVMHCSFDFISGVHVAC